MHSSNVRLHMDASYTCSVAYRLLRRLMPSEHEHWPVKQSVPSRMASFAKK